MGRDVPQGCPIWPVCQYHGNLLITGGNDCLSLLSPCLESHTLSLGFPVNYVNNQVVAGGLCPQLVKPGPKLRCGVGAPGSLVEVLQLDKILARVDEL